MLKLQTQNHSTSVGRIKLVKNLRINPPFVWHRGIGRTLNRPVKQSVVRREVSAFAEIQDRAVLGDGKRGIRVNLDCKSSERSSIVHMPFLLGKMLLVLCDFKSTVKIKHVVCISGICT